VSIMDNDEWIANLQARAKDPGVVLMAVVYDRKANTAYFAGNRGYYTPTEIGNALLVLGETLTKYFPTGGCPKCDAKVAVVAACLEEMKYAFHLLSQRQHNHKKPGELN
jgi:hypothetical protein